MSNDLENSFLRSENSRLSSEVARESQENDFLRSQLAHSATTAQNGGVMARMARERIKELEAQLADAQAIIERKNESLADWMASQKAFKALATALREEGQAHPDKDAHPLANSKELRQKIVDDTYAKELQNIKSGKNN